MDTFLHNLPDRALTLGQQLLGAALAYMIGQWIIGLLVKLASASMNRRHVDPTLANYGVSTLKGALNVLLFISVLGVLGIQTASFAAIFVAFGLAIGTAMGGLLAHLAAGVFLMVLRPFRVGDFISAGGVTSTVTEIGPFATQINTPDNILTVVGNNKIFADNIQNFSHNPYRRMDLSRHFGADVDLRTLAADLKARLLEVPNVLATPAPDVEILEFRAGGPLVGIRPFTANAHYWQVYFDSNAVIAAYCDEKGLAAPEQAVVVRQGDATPVMSGARRPSAKTNGAAVPVVPVV